jgi:exodeoxyribonuclease VII small subunit
VTETKGAGLAAGDPAGDLSFEEALARLEAVVARLEKGEEPLETALELFEEGIRLSRLLTARLEEAQARIDEVVADGTGGTALRPFAPGDAGEDEA